MIDEPIPQPGKPMLDLLVDENGISLLVRVCWGLLAACVIATAVLVATQ